MKPLDPLEEALSRCRYGNYQIGFVMVGPELAEVWLGANVHNRSTSKQSLAAYTEDMKSGLWEFDGAPIRFDERMHLIDGQHRLRGILASGKAQLMLVLVGLPSVVMDVTDTGRRRSGTDMFDLHGVERASRVSVLTRHVAAFNRGEIRTAASRPASVISNATLREVQAKDPAIDWAVEVAARFGGPIPTSPSSVGFFLWFVAHENRGAAVDYIDSLATMRTTGPGDPRLAVLRRLVEPTRVDRDIAQLVEARSRKLRLIPGAYVLLRGWQAVRAGEPLHAIPLTKQSEPVKFPPRVSD